MPLESAMNVFYVRSLQKILKLTTKKHEKLRQVCNEILAEAKKLEKTKSNILKELSLNPNKYFKPLELACATKKPPIMETALDCLQKLMAYGYIDGQAKYEGEPSKLLIDIVVATICGCFEPNQEDAVQLQIIKALLTAVTSCDIQGKSVRITVKTSFNIHLVSKNAVNQKTAKATLTQMLNVIFQRMESKKSPMPKFESAVSPMEGDDDLDEGIASSNGLEFDSPKPVKQPSQKKQEIDEFSNGTTTASSPSTPAVEDNEDTAIARFVAGVFDKILEQHGAAPQSNAAKPQFANQYQKDAFFIFRALCRLSMKKIPPNSAPDSMEMRSRILSLQLIHSVLENSGPVFRSSESFINDIKQFLCLSLLKNCVSTVPSIFHLSLSIFQTLIINFKENLKVEIGMFFTNVFLRILESNNSTFQHKISVIEVLHNICQDTQTLVDLFVNYDCALESLNIYESLVSNLARSVQQTHAEVNWVTPAQEAKIKFAGLQTIIAILKSLKNWTQKSNKPESSESESVESAASTSKAAVSAEILEKQRHMKLDLKEGIALFKEKPKKGVEFLISAGQLKDDPHDIATFLYTCEGLDKKAIGELIGGKDTGAIRNAFVELQHFNGMDFEQGLRAFLNTFRLPGEGQMIDRVVQAFAGKFYKDNPDSVFKNADAAYVFAYAVIMLNTELHSPAFANRKRMDLAGFLKNNETINDGGNLDEAYQTKVFNSIKNNEIKLKEEHFKEEKKEEDVEAATLTTAKKKQLLFDREGAKIVKQTKNMFTESWRQGLMGISNTVFYSANDAEFAKPMFEVSWGPIIAALGIQIEHSDDPQIIQYCLEGLEYGIFIGSRFALPQALNAFIALLAKFTNLNSASVMKQKNIDCIKLVLKIAINDGNFLASGWLQVLTCISQLEKLQNIATGAGADIIVDRSSRPLQRKPSAVIEQTPAKPSNEELNAKVIVKHVDPLILDKIFVKSADLNDEAIVLFVKALCTVSGEELHSQTEPRKFSLQKLIEVAHYNLSRIKIVWSKIWVHMAEHFISVGCHTNQSISMNAIDSLRQLAMKFLEQDELANYHFQRDFLKPFMQIIQQSKSVLIRELIVQCVAQMILKRANNIKSGWKTILQILSVAANDQQETVVKTAFSVVNQIMESFFGMVSNDAFVDYVNCLVEYARNQINAEISLQSIEYLEACARSIVEGNIEGLKVERDEEGVAFHDDKSYKIWFPILIGLSKLVNDGRLDVRMKALNTLFGVLKRYGTLFSGEIWKSIYTGVIFPIFEIIKETLETNQDKTIQETDWMKTTCHRALGQVVDLFSDFYASTSFIFPNVLDLVCSCIRKESELLSIIGTECLKHFITVTATKFTMDNWNSICAAIQLLVDRMSLQELSETSDNYATVNATFVRVKVVTQLLTIQLIHDIVHHQYDYMKTEHVSLLLKSLEAAYLNARTISEGPLYSDVKFDPLVRKLPTSDILKQETSAIQSQMDILLTMFAEKREQHLDRKAFAENLVVDSCYHQLQRYLVKVAIQQPTPEFSAANAKEMEALIPIVVFTLNGIYKFSDDQFAKYYDKFFPVICALILAPHKEVREKVKLLVSRVGSLVKL